MPVSIIRIRKAIYEKFRNNIAGQAKSSDELTEINFFNAFD